MDFGRIIQFMFFIIVILVMAKIMGFADNGVAVIAACVIGGLVYILIFALSSKISNAKKTKNEGRVSSTPVKKPKKKNPNKKKSNTTK